MATMSTFTIVAPLTLLALALVFVPTLIRFIGKAVGWNVRGRTQSRRSLLLARARTEESDGAEGANRIPKLDEEWEKASASRGGRNVEDWDGVIGFFHPFCNAGGGGERVLWAAIRATQERWPRALCVVYTGDHDVDKSTILANVKDRFNIDLHAPRVCFLYLSCRDYVLASTWPRFTLLGQSLGSILLAWDAFNLVVPDIFIDTMGYGFTLAFSKFLFPTVPTGAYVHYPTISTDMLSTLDDKISGRGVNAGLGKGWKGIIKRQYWRLFAWLYSWVGGQVDVVMTNSSWTQNHIKQLWGAKRERNNRRSEIEVVFPPTAVEELEQQVEVSEASEKLRKPNVLYIAQFRPEKNHQMIIKAFAAFMRDHGTALKDDDAPRLVLVGSVRDDADKMLVYKLRVLAREEGVADHVDFVINAKWSEILHLLRTSSVGVNGMWNEHFGIGVVEYQAAGLASVVNDSGGPKLDIVVPIDGIPTGFHASTDLQYAAGFAKVLEMPPEDVLPLREAARKSAKRFTEDVFKQAWNRQTEKMIRLEVQMNKD